MWEKRKIYQHRSTLPSWLITWAPTWKGLLHPITEQVSLFVPVSFFNTADHELASLLSEFWYGAFPVPLIFFTQRLVFLLGWVILPQNFEIHHARENTCLKFALIFWLPSIYTKFHINVSKKKWSLSPLWKQVRFIIKY